VEHRLRDHAAHRCAEIGGMISSTLLTLIVIPAIFGLVKGFQLSPAPNPDISSEGMMAVDRKID
jgi:hypothetical protein